MDKYQLLNFFRDKAANFYEDIETTSLNYKEKAASLNRQIVQLRESYIEDAILSIDHDENKLDTVLHMYLI